jgi:hypothetical protein
MAQKDATTVWATKVKALTGDKTTKLVADLKTKWAAATNPKDITTVYTNA